MFKYKLNKVSLISIFSVPQTPKIYSLIYLIGLIPPVYFTIYSIRNPFIGKWEATQHINGKENVIATMSFGKDLTLVTTSDYMQENTKNATEHI